MAICFSFIYGLVGKLIMSENGPDPEQWQLCIQITSDKSESTGFTPEVISMSL